MHDRNSLLTAAPAKEYTITIEGDEQGGFDPTQKTVVCLSLRQPYGTGNIFKALFKELYRQFKENGAFFYLIIPHTLERFNFHVEENLDIDESLRKSENLKRDWISQNLEADPEIRHMRNEMEAAGKLVILDWIQCRETFSAGLKKANENIEQLVEATDYFYYETITALAYTFYQKAREKHVHNVHFQAACATKGEEEIKGIYWRYSDEESRVAGAWLIDGVTQILYPEKFYENIHGKKSTNPARDLFNCVKQTFDPRGPARMLNLQITAYEPAVAPKTERRKSSIDAAVAKTNKVLEGLKAEKKQLKVEQGKNKIKLKTLENQLEKAQETLKEAERTNSANEENAKVLLAHVNFRIAEMATLRRMIAAQDEGLQEFSNRIWLLENENKQLVAEKSSILDDNIKAHATIEALTAKVEKEMKERVWAHTSDLEVLYPTLKEEKAKRENAEIEVRSSLVTAQDMTAVACELRSERKELKTLNDQHVKDKQNLETELEEARTQRDAATATLHELQTQVLDVRQQQEEIETTRKAQAEKEKELEAKALELRQLQEEFEKQRKAQAEKEKETLRTLAEKTVTLQTREAVVKQKEERLEKRAANLDLQEFTFEIKEKEKLHVIAHQTAEQMTKEAFGEKEEEFRQQREEAHTPGEEVQSPNRSESRKSRPRGQHSLPSLPSSSVSPTEHTFKQGLQEAFHNFTQKIIPHSMWNTSKDTDEHSRSSTASPSPRDESTLMSPMPRLRIISGFLHKKSPHSSTHSDDQTSEEGFNFRSRTPSAEAVANSEKTTPPALK